MTTATEQPTLYNVNADPADAVTGHAVLGLILAAAARRPHLRNAIESFQFDTERGIGVLVKDAGQRQHLANALGFAPKVTSFRVNSGGFQGTGNRRNSVIEGIKVTIWNYEA